MLKKKKKRKNGSGFMVMFPFTTMVYIYSTYDPSFIHYFSAVKQVGFFLFWSYTGGDMMVLVQNKVLCWFVSCTVCFFLMQQNELQYQSSPNIRNVF